jgi:hypothetical protein
MNNGLCVDRSSPNISGFFFYQKQMKKLDDLSSEAKDLRLCLAKSFS